MVAAPLIALAAPITLLLRLASPETRRRVVLPILHSRVMRFISFPAVAWIAFAAVMWGAHFSPLFDAALENPLAHDLEHALFLGTALLFWWPVVAADPMPWRLAHPSRSLYTFLQMPQNTFLAVIILSASVPLYQHYATLAAAVAGLDGDRPGRPASRRRDHVGRWRPPVHRRDRRGRVGLDACRGGGHGTVGSPRRRGARRDPGRGRRRWPSGGPKAAGPGQPAGR